MRKMIVVNYDKGFAEMLQHPAFRNRRTRRHPVDVDSSLLAPRRPHARLTATRRRAKLRWQRSSRAQKVADGLFAKYIRIALAIFRKFDDSFGYAVAGVKIAPVLPNRLASHFECNVHDPRRFRVKLLVAEEWCDWHDPYPIAVSFHQKRTPKPL